MILSKEEAEEIFISETLKKYLGKEINYNKFKKSCEFLSIDEKQEIYEKINKIISEKRIIADEAVEELLNIIKDFTIWDIGKYNYELSELTEKIRDNDYFYSTRLTLYKRIIEFPKYKDLDEDEKIKIAMKIGSLDCTDFKGISK